MDNSTTERNLKPSSYKAPTIQIFNTNQFDKLSLGIHLFTPKLTAEVNFGGLGLGGRA